MLLLHFYCQKWTWFNSRSFTVNYVRKYAACSLCGHKDIADDAQKNICKRVWDKTDWAADCLSAHVQLYEWVLWKGAPHRPKTHTHKQKACARAHVHRGPENKCKTCEEEVTSEYAKKTLPQAWDFNDETIHYGIRSLCFCCHEMYTFIIIPPRTQSIVPLRQTTLDGNIF